jgi:hypothetical protein
VPGNLPNPNAAQNVFPINRVDGFLAPQLVMEVAVSNETMPILAGADLDRYFAAGTGTRAWIGIKVWRSAVNGGTHRWWAGHAARRMVNGVFQNGWVMDPQPMTVVAHHNQDLSIPTNIIFNVDVQNLIHPCLPPAGYPATLDLDLELIRRVICRNLH